MLCLFTCTKEVIDDANNLLIRHGLVGVLVQLPVFAVVNEGVCDVTDVILQQNTICEYKMLRW